MTLELTKADGTILTLSQVAYYHIWNRTCPGLEILKVSFQSQLPNLEYFLVPHYVSVDELQ